MEPLYPKVIEATGHECDYCGRQATKIHFVRAFAYEAPIIDDKIKWEEEAQLYETDSDMFDDEYLCDNAPECSKE